jgi:hypothetical protein
MINAPYLIAWLNLVMAWAMLGYELPYNATMFIASTFMWALLWAVHRIEKVVKEVTQ